MNDGEYFQQQGVYDPAFEHDSCGVAAEGANTYLGSLTTKMS